MADRRNQLVARVRELLAEALGASRTRSAAAQLALTSARERSVRVRRAATGVPERVGAERDRRLAEIDARHASRLEVLARRAAEAAIREAPGAGSADWPAWRPTPAGRAEPPGATRVGTVRLVGAEPVPALVALLDGGHVALDGDAEGCAAIVSALLLRSLGRAAPGGVRLVGYDPDQLGGGLAGFAPLGPAGLLTFVGPGGLGRLLDDLVEQIRRVNETVLAGEHTSLRQLAAATGRRPEPWRVAVLLGGDELSRHERGQLDRVVRAGVACGVHLIVRGVALPDDPAVTRVTVTADGARIGTLPVRLDPPPPATLVTETCREIASVVSAGPAPTPFTDLLPPADQMWQEDSATGLTAPIGEGPQGRPVLLTLGDYPPHALIGGPSGTGKTNLIFAWIGALAARYSPAELEFYLLDFKEGVSFARFAKGRRDPSWLPHMRLVGINVNTDREFGLALLRFLAEELRRRADAAKKHEVTKLAELRAVDPTGHWPRIVAVVDEFQMLLAGRDAVAREAADLLEDLARRGRSQGIHLVLASQDVRGIEALWGRPALVAQFTLRIALPKALRILAERNDAAQSLPRHHAVVNAESGLTEGNEVARIPSASDWETWSDLQHRLWRMRPADAAPARLFDGDAIPQLTDAPDFRALRAPEVGTPRSPVALLGEIIDVQARSAALRLPRAPGRNLAVLGTRIDEACAVLDAAARSLARQHRPGTARFSIACLDPDADPAARALYEDLADDAAWYDEETVAELMAETAEGLGAPGATGTPHYLLLFAVDAAAGSLAARSGRATGLEQLRRILHDGPERRTHVLAWWRGVARMRADLGGTGSRTDQIGAWVALDTHGGELGSSLYPGSSGPDWYPRPWRGLFFDRAVHRTGQTIIPYGPSR
ncbi:FtsK/SpoIIIE family protein [Micromonospora phaseoli]|uniref:FtsK/SpoIIIE family protein n=1 Tax=Micromonospora phaseoli TaxID=1144548 RepID=A0A1H6YWF5_9ACTN|nr:FtsK/SpoIIIE domain-containing protein [Micromonospora phaseoli]PZW00245.1 FtsK/SpoIIIE family protein [Micromonospora phaseoli]GIJ81011.1 cell division protein FtsK [Micromonospora phaseoli]SEJ41702.1 FtsK/SpoIIIE family protein [Micromonospora phaseoli]